MSRVLEIVLSLPLQIRLAGHGGRRASRAPRDFGAELVRAWRIFSQVKMRRGHEHVVIEPCRAGEAEAAARHDAQWWNWVETSSRERRVLAASVQGFVPGVSIREMHDADDDAVRVAVPEVSAGAMAPVSHTASHAASYAAPATPLAGTASPDAESKNAPPSRDSLPADAALPAAHTSLGDTNAPMLTSERRRGRWLDGGGVEVALTLDDITLQLDEAESMRCCELRLSVPDPGERAARAAALAVLFAAARELSGAWPAFPLSMSTLDRVCANGGAPLHAAPVKAKDTDLRGVRAQRDALCALGRSVTAQWLGNEIGVRESDDPEYVHQMRVALRRLRTLMRLFPRYADDAWKAAFADELRWLAKVLGAVRDWDVCVTSTLPALAAADDSDAWDDTLAAARAQRDAARTELRQALGSARYARLALSWLEWLCRLALTDDDPDSPSPKPLKRHAARRVSRLFGHLYDSPQLTTLDAAARHRVRIGAKHLRYALEFFASLASRRTRGETARVLASVQTTLGEANDAVAALHRLEQLPASPHQLGFARGYAAAAQDYAARIAETQLRELRQPKIAGRGG